ncbi:MAG: hypothetical protein R6V58_14015 [Planctomycetota bacterium]
MRGTYVLVGCLLLAAPAAAGEPPRSFAPVDVEKIPANTWVKATPDHRGPAFSNVVYDPARGRVLHWGAWLARRGPRAENAEIAEDVVAAHKSTVLH